MNEKKQSFNREQTAAMVLMILVMVARGSSFVFSKKLMNSMAPLNVLAVRFILSFFVLVCVFYKRLLQLNIRVIKKGMILGTLYTITMFAEMYGLKRIDPGTSSFIENSAIVIVPLYYALFFRRRPKRKELLCAVIALIGVGCLTLTNGMTINVGVLYAVIAALCFGICIIATDVVAREDDPLLIGIFQLGFMGVFSLVFTMLFEQPRLPADRSEWYMILLLALICSCFGFAFQPVAQKYISAHIAAVFTAVNPLATSVISILMKEEQISASKVFGSIFIILAVLLSVIQKEDSHFCRQTGDLSDSAETI